jgi:hypothetical protein
VPPTRAASPRSLEFYYGVHLRVLVLLFTRFCCPVVLLFCCRPSAVGFTMSSTTLHQHDDLSSEDFLRRVKTLTETKDREDRQRAADLEKDIIQSREQRKARRAGEYRAIILQWLIKCFIAVFLTDTAVFSHRPRSISLQHSAKSRNSFTHRFRLSHHSRRAQNGQFARVSHLSCAFWHTVMAAASEAPLSDRSRE